MTTKLTLATLIATALLVACSASDRPADTAAATPAPATAPAVSAPPPTAPAPEPAPAAPVGGDTIAGWYMEHGDMGMFQRCGQDAQLGVDSAELRAEARKFGLEPNTPVYVRVVGTSDGSKVSVTRVEQFGSPTPVRDCGLTGVVTPAGE